MTIRFVSMFCLLWSKSKFPMVRRNTLILPSPERLVVVPDQLAVFPRAVALLAKFVHGLAGRLDRIAAGLRRQIEIKRRRRKRLRAENLHLIELDAELDLVGFEEPCLCERHNGFASHQ